MAVDRSLPFEMRALEGALANVSRLLTEEAAALEARAVPAADRLAKRVTCSSLKLATYPCICSAADRLAKQVNLTIFPCVKGQCCQLWAVLAMDFGLLDFPGNVQAVEQQRKKVICCGLCVYCFMLPSSGCSGLQGHAFRLCLWLVVHTCCVGSELNIA